MRIYRGWFFMRNVLKCVIEVNLILNVVSTRNIFKFCRFIDIKQLVDLSKYLFILSVIFTNIYFIVSHIVKEKTNKKT
uniref:Uncharacterized protein n=2 Tax=Nyssomyia neivai TaxID=330878 RepID=A0A1L8D6Q7_9DIPT